jgi:hypothetical protein
MKGGSQQIVFRGMVSPSQRIAILGNWGPKSTSTVCFDGDFRRVVETLTESELKPRTSEAVLPSMSAWKTVPWRLSLLNRQERYNRGG